MNAIGKDRLGEMGMRFFAFVQFRKKELVRTGELVESLGLTPLQERKLLSRLAMSGLIVRLKRGVYLVPPRLPTGGVWSPDEAVILRELMKAYDGGRYQICGPNAFSRYGFTDQIPTRTYVYNDRIYSDRKIGSVSFVFIKTATQRLGAVERIKTTEGNTVYFSSRTRTLMDAVYDWSRFNTLPRAYEWICESLSREVSLKADLIGVVERYGNVGTKRRIGYVLERLGGECPGLLSLKRSLPRTTAFIPLVPRRPARGKNDKSWAVIDNREAEE